MKYQLSIIIEKPLKEVTKLYTNRALLPQWQPDLLDSKQIENYPNPKFSHQLALGRRKIVMTETILRSKLPDHYDANYKLKGISNTAYNSFNEVHDGVTRWVCNTEYTFSGIMKIISIFMKGGLKKQSEMIMINFKRFAESQGK